MARGDDPSNPPGPGVDARGTPVEDPTKNVLETLNAAVRRLDDLRVLTAQNLTAMASLRAEHDKEMREKEAQRIDAIRAVDVAASQQSTKDAETRATALAAQVAASAEAMRNQVAAAATATAVSLSQALAPIQQSIAELTQRMYEQQGQKQQSTETREVGADNRSQNTFLLYAVIVVLAIVSAAVGVIALRQDATPTPPTVVTVTTPG